MSHHIPISDKYREGFEKRLVRAYREGVPVHEMRDRFRCSDKVIVKTVIRHGVPLRTDVRRGRPAQQGAPA